MIDNNTNCKKVDRGFTLIELLVVISIISVLMAILLPCLRLIKEQARRAVCQNNLHQGGAAIFMYAGDLDGACRFVKFNDLNPSNHEGEYLVYYDKGS